MEGALVFLHGSVQVLGLFIELPQGGAGLQCGVLLLVVNVERLCLGYLDLIAVSKAGKRSLLLRRSADAPIRYFYGNPVPVWAASLACLPKSVSGRQNFHLARIAGWGLKPAVRRPVGGSRLVMALPDTLSVQVPGR